MKVVCADVDFPQRDAPHCVNVRRIAPVNCGSAKRSAPTIPPEIGNKFDMFEELLTKQVRFANFLSKATFCVIA